MGTSRTMEAPTWVPHSGGCCTWFYLISKFGAEEMMRHIEELDSSDRSAAAATAVADVLLTFGTLVLVSGTPSSIGLLEKCFEGRWRVRFADGGAGTFTAGNLKTLSVQSQRADSDLVRALTTHGS